MLGSLAPKRSISQSDIQQQLRLFSTSIEQYQQHMQQHYQKYQPISFEQLKSRILESQSYLEQYYQECSSQRQMLGNLFARHVENLNQAVRQFSQYKVKIGDLEQNIEDKQMCLQEYKQKLDARDKQISQISILLQTSRQDNASLYYQIDEKQVQLETDRKQSHKTFLEVRQQSQLDRKMVEQLYDSQQQLRLTIIELKNQKALSVQRYHKLEQQYSRVNSRCAELEFKLKEKDEQIQNIVLEKQRVRKQSEDFYKEHDSEDNQDKDQVYHRSSFLQQVSAQQHKTKLSQQVQNYQIPIIKELTPFQSYPPKKSFDQLSDVFSQAQYFQAKITENRNQVIGISKKKAIALIDPYYSHYILTSQSIKIKEDCQDMLNIDMKPYYKQVIDKRIPMHLWDQWIKNRLRELTKRKLQA